MENLTIQEQHQRFLKSLELQKRYSKFTILAYRVEFKLFQKFLAELKIEQLEDINPKIIQEYLYLLSSKDYAPASIRRRLFGLSSFFNYCKKWELISKNPVSSIAIPPKPKQLPYFLIEEDISKLLKETRKGRKRKKNRAAKLLYVALEVLLLTGIRRAELLGLDWEDILYSKSLIHLKRTKGGKERYIPMLKKLSKILKTYQEETNSKPHEPIFTSQYGTRISDGAFTKLFKKYVEMAGLDVKKVKIHTMRHTFASLLAQEGVSLLELKDLLGHEDIGSTMIYAHLTKNRLHEVIKKHPLAGNKRRNKLT